MYRYHLSSHALVSCRILGILLALLVSAVVGSTVCLATEETAGTNGGGSGQDHDNGEDDSRPLHKQVYDWLKLSTEIQKTTPKDTTKKERVGQIGKDLQDSFIKLIGILSEPTSARTKREELAEIASQVRSAGAELHALEGLEPQAEKLLHASRSIEQAAGLKGAHFLMRAGVVMLKPYKLTLETVANEGDAFKVECAEEKDYQAFLEVVFRNRRAWRDVKLCKGTHWFADQDFRIGYVYAQDEEATASTIVGSGDVYAEAYMSTIGWDVFGKDGNGFRGTLSVDAFGSLTTQRKDLDVLGQYGFGPTLTLTAPRLGGGIRRVEGVFGVYLSWLEIPDYLGPDFADGKDLYAAADRGHPDYTMDTVCAVRADVAVPIGLSGIVTLSARINACVEGANPWSLWLSLSTDGEALAAILGR